MKCKEPSLGRVNKHYEQALRYLPEFEDAYMDEPKLRRFAIILRDICHTAKAEEFKLRAADALWNSVNHLLGQTPTPAMIKRNAMHVIANWNFIEEGVAIPQWDGTPIVSDVVFIGVARLQHEEGTQPKLYVKLKLKTGLCAGIITGVSLTSSKIGYFLDHIAGVSREHCSVEEIAGMQARLQVAWESGKLVVLDWQATGTHKANNRKITEARSDAAKCTRSQPCNVCTADVTQCKLAVWLPRKKKENEQSKN